jgi:serine-aspartate repeat-containing protein C/D/E
MFVLLLAKIMSKDKSGSTKETKQKSSKNSATTGLPQTTTVDNGGGLGIISNPSIPTATVPAGTVVTNSTTTNVDTCTTTDPVVNTPTPIPAHTPIISSMGQSTVRIIGSSTIDEGTSGNFALQVDTVSDVDRTFTMQVSNGTANRFNGDGANQRYKGDAKQDGKQFSPDDTRDFTIYDSQGQMVTGETIEITIKAGQTTSEKYSVTAWKETSSISGVNKNPTGAYGMAEGNETFSCKIVDPCGCYVAKPQMDVTIIDTSVNRYHSPLAIDLNGDGVKSLSIDAGVKFDILNSGTKTSVGWISGNDGLLAIDNNRNGKIDNRSELFGGGVGEGFAQLSTFDTNKDGIVSAADKGFDALKIWKDSNSNGITDAGELQALSVFGIKSLNLAHKSTFELDKQGNVMGERGSVNLANGKAADMVDVYFQVGNPVTTSSSILG